jgi:membrane protein implicated in regulation of membrane protease activity
MTFIETVIADYPVLTWAGLGVLLLVAEVLLVPGFFLSFAAAAFLVALATAFGLLPFEFLWKALIFVVVGVATIPLFRNLLRKYFDRTPDINQY